MLNVKKILRFSLLLAITVIGLIALNSHLPVWAGNRYALICIGNRTQHSEIRYIFRWGSDEWSSKRVSDGWTWHSWQYDRVNTNSSPEFQIRFDSDLSSDNYPITYTLERYAAPEQSCRYGRKYVFEQDGASGRYIDLKKVSS